MMARRSPAAGLRHGAVFRDKVAGFANRADHVGASHVPVAKGLANGPDIMIRVVERGPDQIVHASVDDDEMLLAAPLGVDHLGHKNPGVARDDAARLKQELGAEAVRKSGDDLGIVVRQRRFLKVPAIGNAKAAAKVHEGYGVPVATASPPRGSPAERKRS